MPGTGGRPAKLTPEVQKRLCDAIGAGNYYATACTFAGIGYNTFRRWMIAGKQAKRGKFREFWEAVKRAEATAEVAVVAQWRQHCADSPSACRDFLDRRYNGRWGRRDKVEVTDQNKADILLSVHMQEALAKDGTAELLAALTERVFGQAPALEPGQPGGDRQPPPLALGPPPGPAQPAADPGGDGQG